MPPRPNAPVYLDNQATTRCDPRVVATMLPYFIDDYANAHSAEHAMGRRAEAAVEHARAQVAALLGAAPREIVLTSGATESNNIAIKGAARFARRMETDRRRIVTVATEHKCVLEAVADLAVLQLRSHPARYPDALHAILRVAALTQAGVTLAQMDLIELNEAFASQVLACTREWKFVPRDFERLNVNGSGISLGHPVGATGGRIL